MFIDRVYMDNGSYDLADDVMFEIANRSSDLEQSAAWLVQQTIEGCDDEFLDNLQEMIDKERGVKTVLAAGLKNVVDEERRKQSSAGDPS